MKTKDFWYDLPEELIAQTPLEQRDSSRLLVLGKESGEVSHKHFYDIIDYLQRGSGVIVFIQPFTEKTDGLRKSAGRSIAE